MSTNSKRVGFTLNRTSNNSFVPYTNIKFYLYYGHGQIFLPAHNLLYDETGRYGTSAV